jgi:hypothetical protein
MSDPWTAHIRSGSFPTAKSWSTGLVWCLDRIPKRILGLVRVSDTPTGKFLVGTIKGGLHPLYSFGHSIDLKKLST